VSRRPFAKSTLATWRMAELGFLGDMVTTRVTIPLACGHLRSMGVRDNVGFLYLGPDLRYLFFLRED
jgi:hypothetical protein